MRVSTPVQIGATQRRTRRDLNARSEWRGTISFQSAHFVMQPGNNNSSGSAQTNMHTKCTSACDNFSSRSLSASLARVHVRTQYLCGAHDKMCSRTKIIHVRSSESDDADDALLSCTTMSQCSEPHLRLVNYVALMRIRAQPRRHHALCVTYLRRLSRNKPIAPMPSAGTTSAPSPSMSTRGATLLMRPGTSEPMVPMTEAAD